MGLDVYLYPKTDHDLNTAYWAAWEAEYESFDKIAPAEKEAWDAAHPQASHADVASLTYPDHMFNRRYLHSSYNGGGFNRAVPEMTGTDHDLYWIFEPVRTGEESPDLTTEHLDALRQCRARAVQVVEELKACDRLRTLTVEPNALMQPPQLDDDGALALFRKQVTDMGEQWTKSAEKKSAFASRDGEFFPGGFEIVGALPGMYDRFGSRWFGVHLIFRTGDEGFDYYVQAAEITVEFCDEAIALIEKTGAAHMSWSG